MMRICIQKSTGRLIESQSDATAGTLIANAISAGFSSSDVEERIVSMTDWQVMLDAQKPAPAVDKRALAIDALMVKTAADPLAPQAVKDYAATVK